MTTGADIIGERFYAYGPLTAVVSVDRIKAGRLPENVELPAILVRTVSSVERQPLKRNGKPRTKDRVAALVRAASYREQKAIIKLMIEAGAGFIGEAAGATGVSILTDGTGPDVQGPGNSFEQTQDFKVSFNL